jgi:DNA topoisomerase 2-associated protein PAT1
LISTRIDFEDTYDGLGDQLDEANDDLNDDTFGTEAIGASGSKAVGKDFDFFGQTAKVANAITEEQMRFNRQQAPPKTLATPAASAGVQKSRPYRSGYEKYRDPGQLSDLQVDPNLWGTVAGPSTAVNQTKNQALGTSQQPNSNAAPARKMLSLEEVEAQLRAQAKKPSSGQSVQRQAPTQAPTNVAPITQQGSYSKGSDMQGYSVQEPIRGQQTNTIPRTQYHPRAQPPPSVQAELPAPMVPEPQITPRPLSAAQPQQEAENAQPRQILQNPLRNQSQSGPIPVILPQGPQFQSQVRPQGASQIITHPQQLLQMSEEERAAFLIEDAKRAKRNHKIFLMSKDNGLMTPQDKNFITRIQLQQLMTATGNTNEHDPDASLAEDFYYQVHSQIRGGPRQNPHQPLSHFAQTYLFQTGGRMAGNRRHNRGDNHMQRMEQQVQRAVEAAKLKPKNKQLVIEGSLGKISFSNAKTPKPLLNIKRNESGDWTNRPQSANRHMSGRAATQTELSANDRKTVLKNIEAVYTTLMQMEDLMRREPLAPPSEGEGNVAEEHLKWEQRMQGLNEKLWSDLKVLEPIDPGSAIPHPFIAILSYAKGKKAIPRVFRHLSTEQRVTMLTIIVLHLDILDVVRLGQIRPGETELPVTSREAVDLFSAAVTPSLFSYVSEAPLYNVIGFLGLILDRVNVQAIARTRVGLSILTMLTSRATLVREAGGTDDAEWQQWSQFYNRLFDILEPTLESCFPGSVNTGEDIYVWQFLAAIGSGASPEQQQRLVLAVK